jgi:hypothetical protein
LCGGGNAIHVLSSYVGANPDCEVSVLTLFPGEAERFREAIPEEGIKCMNDLGEPVLGKPTLVSDDPAKVAPDPTLSFLPFPPLPMNFTSRP